MNIFISNLSYAVKDSDLRELFEEYGEVSSVKVIMDRITGRSRGFGFVEMNDEFAKKAIEELNQAEYDGKIINVSEAKPRENRSSNFENRKSFGGNKNSGGNFQERRQYKN